MKVNVDYDLCESNAICMNIAPDVFEVRDDDFLYLLNEHPEPGRVTEQPEQRCAFLGGQWSVQHLHICEDITVNGPCTPKLPPTSRT